MTYPQTRDREEKETEKSYPKGPQKDGEQKDIPSSIRHLEKAPSNTIYLEKEIGSLNGKLVQKRMNKERLLLALAKLEGEIGQLMKEIESRKKTVFFFFFFFVHCCIVLCCIELCCVVLCWFRYPLVCCVSLLTADFSLELREKKENSPPKNRRNRLEELWYFLPLLPFLSSFFLTSPPLSRTQKKNHKSEGPGFSPSSISKTLRLKVRREEIERNFRFLGGVLTKGKRRRGKGSQ